MPEKGSTIKYKLIDDEVWQTATVLGRAGNTRGRNKWWSNIQKEDQSLGSLNMAELDLWEYINEEILLCSNDDTHDVLHAKMVELEKLTRHEVFTEVENEGYKLIDTRWILTENWKNGKKQTKARLVAIGFQEKDTNNLRKDSPTCLKESLSLVLCIASSNTWTVRVLDIKSAFLQGHTIQRDVYLKPPL